MASDLRQAPTEEGAQKNDERKKTEEKIKQYQHSYNIILHDTLGPKKKVDLKLAKQKDVLTRYQEDRDKLISQTFTSEQGRKREIEFLQTFVDYIREKAFLENETKNIRKEIKELAHRNAALEKDIKRKSQEISKRKATLSGIEESSDRSDAILNNLENKLCQARMALNQTIMTCKEYRREIDDCLAERNKFRQMLDSANMKLKLGKSCMLDMIEQAAMATAKRDFAKERLKRLISESKSTAKKQAYVYGQLNNALGVFIDRAVFQSIKIQKRVSKGLEAKKQLEILIKRQNLETSVRKTKLLYQNIKQFYGVDSIDDSARLFKEAYNNKGSLFKFAIDTFTEGDQLHKRNATLLYTCDQIKKLTSSLISMEREKLDLTYNDCIFLQERIQELKKKLEHARTLKEFTILRLNMMFNKAGGNFQKFSKILGDNSRITENNKDLMMREIERKIVLLIGNLYFAERTKKDIDALPLKRYLLYLPSSDDNSHVKQRIFGVGIKTPCPVCAEAEQFGLRKEGKDVVVPFEQMNNAILSSMDSETTKNHLHSVSHCHLPGSRKMLQQRFLKIGH